MQSYLLTLPNCIDVAHNVKCQMSNVKMQINQKPTHLQILKNTHTLFNN